MHSSLKARRGLLQSTLRALDEAIARSPDNAALKARRTDLAGELQTVAMPGEIEWMRRRLAELESEMAQVRTATTADEARLLDLIREHEQLLADITETERWTPSNR